MSATEDTSKHYSDDGFWEKVKKYAMIAGQEVIEKALWLYYAGRREETPVWAKALIGATLGYFIWPLDAIPDVTPIVGYADDLGALTAAAATLIAYIDDDVKAKTKEKLSKWFGPRDQD
jgi:uncharacterized membrane protein YkvA (DUF1232 family)